MTHKEAPVHEIMTYGKRLYVVLILLLIFLYVAATAIYIIFIGPIEEQRAETLCSTLPPSYAIQGRIVGQVGAMRYPVAGAQVVVDVQPSLDVGCESWRQEPYQVRLVTDNQGHFDSEFRYPHRAALDVTITVAHCTPYQRHLSGLQYDDQFGTRPDGYFLIDCDESFVATFRDAASVTGIGGTASGGN